LYLLITHGLKAPALLGCLSETNQIALITCIA
jgi:hypothetical protein